jgi:hypothetical protein
MRVYKGYEIVRLQQSSDYSSNFGIKSLKYNADHFYSSENSLVIKSVAAAKRIINSIKNN